jgi:hypothetical protein
LVDLVIDLQNQQVQFRSLTDNIDTNTPAGRFFFHVMASPAKMERELIVERTRAGLESGGDHLGPRGAGNGSHPESGVILDICSSLRNVVD